MIRRLIACLVLALLCGSCDLWSDRARIAFVFEAKEAVGAGELRKAADIQTENADVEIFTGEQGARALKSAADLVEFDVVFIDGKADGLPLRKEDIDSIKKATRLVVVNPKGELSGNVSLASYSDIPKYWSNRSVENDANLIAFLASRIAGAKITGRVDSPVIYPRHAFYHPAAPGLFETVEAYREWYKKRTGGHVYDSAKSSVGISSYLFNYRQKNTAAIDRTIAEIERQGGNAFALLRFEQADYSPFISNGEAIIDVLLHDGDQLNYQDRAAGIEEVRRLGVPVLQSITYYKGSPSDYRKAPGGLAPDLVPRVVDAEREGMFEPIAVAAKDVESKTRRYVPIDGQPEWRVKRALSWANLRRKVNADKRVAFTYWSEAGGKSDVGGDPDDFLDVQGSLVRLLRDMRTRGYDIGQDPIPTAKDLADRMAATASNVGSWAPAELNKRVRDGVVAVLPEALYLEWYKQLPVQRRQEIEAVWGPPPGKVMTVSAPDGSRLIVIPRITFGNILIAPHPMWGYLEDEKVLLSKDALPPHHQYLAFFLWMQNEWKADIWVSLFSNIVLQPGKSQGPLADDHIAILLGGMPHIHPERLGANGAVGNKRKAMALVPGWYNIVTPSDAGEAFSGLKGLLDRYGPLPETERKQFDEPIRSTLKQTGIDRSLGMDVNVAPLHTLVEKAERYIAALEARNVPWGSKVLGEAPKDGALAAMVAGMLGRDLELAIGSPGDTTRAAARRLVSSVIVDGRAPSEAAKNILQRTSPEIEAQLSRGLEYSALLKTAPREVDALLAALDGQWLEPGPMGEPFRKPDTLPPGRTLYNFDQRQVPTLEAEAVGRKQAEALIQAWKDEHGGSYPKKLALVLFSADIAKTNGASEAQVLHLLGTRVKRNWRGEVIGVELIPRSELGRPRVDVFVTTSGVYRDQFQDKVALLDDAVKLAALSPEADNPVRKAISEETGKLKKAGESDANARLLAAARIFAPAPGAYSPSIQFLAKSGEQRGDEARMADLFTRRMSHAYGGGLYGRYSQDALKSNLAAMDGAILPRTSDVNGMLDQPMAAGFLGGLNLAAKSITGQESSLYVSSLQDPEQPRVEKAADVIQAELRTRYFNPKWLKENQAHGYDGARNFMFLTDNLDLWDSTATNMVTSEDWAEVKAVFVDDKFDLGMDAFFDRENPFAQQMLLTNLLGAAQRGNWKATPEELAQVAQRITESVAKHGPACEANQCRNPGMTEFIARAMEVLPNAAPLLASYQASIAAAVSIAAPSMAPTVTGQAVEEVKLPEKDVTEVRFLLVGLAVAAILLVTTGWFVGGTHLDFAGRPGLERREL